VPRTDAATHARRQRARAEAAAQLPPDVRGETDWAAVDALTDDDIRQAVANDPDAAPILEGAALADWFATAERYMPEPAPAKAGVFLKLDADVLEWFKAQGRGYQARLNAVLRGYVESRAARERST